MNFQFSSLADFLFMSGHGPYVWAAYIVALLVLVALVIWPQTRIRRQRRDLARQLRIEEARRRSARPHAKPVERSAIA
ncbi:MULTISPECIES: heme exporter protein CcmD [Microbulbifer]|uniref:Heme exporter protein D n=1 Tax=Microbulbifer celer TaxID=435905 RepID=A0ABW3UCL3_9GAMM|nr:MULTISPECIES: heme exporter protein CcmD [Microbulbifer]UFN59105.1 heme exporter protein CcmD [Microbulbifer celer]